MWGMSTIIAAFILALVVASVVFANVVLAVPLALVGVALLGFMDLKRRRKQAGMIHTHRQRAETDKVDFSRRDRETLVSE
jgi:UDP-N-acetylmuramyl pentapeptide phosphotransferase/UDP-N-acetylglucosamine-1-phosphate transferase